MWVGLSAATRGATSASTTTGHRDFGRHSEARTHAVGDIIHGYVLCLFVKILVDHHGKAIDFKHVIRCFRFIQNHCQGRPGSPTGLEKNPDRSDFLLLEIVFQDVLCLFRQVYHLDKSPFVLTADFALII